MCKLFIEWSNEIQQYCESNGLNYDKAKSLCKGCGKDFMFLQYFDPESESVKKGSGLRDETPMPLVLAIYKQPDGSLKFEQTEHTKKYLS